MHGRIKIQFHWDRARREGQEQLVLGPRRAALGRQGLRHVRPAAGRPRGGRPVPRRRSRSSARHRLGLQQGQHAAVEAARPVDGQRRQDAEQQGAATSTPPTSCASTTRRAASTSGSRPRRTSIGWCGNDAFDFDRQQRVGQGGADAQRGDRRELVPRRHQGRDAQPRQGPARQGRRRHLLHRRRDLPDEDRQGHTAPRSAATSASTSAARRS